MPLPAWLRGPSFHSRRLRTPPASSVPSPRIHRPGWWPSQRLPWSPGDPRAGVNVRCSAPKPLEGHSGMPIWLVRVHFHTPGAPCSPTTAPPCQSALSFLACKTGKLHSPEDLRREKLWTKRENGDESASTSENTS